MIQALVAYKNSEVENPLRYRTISYFFSSVYTTIKFYTSTKKQHLSNLLLVSDPFVPDSVPVLNFQISLLP